MKNDSCDACRYEPIETTAYTMNGRYPKPEVKHLCALCAGTMAGVALEYPEQYPNREILFTISHVGNAILAAIKASSR